MLAYDQLNYIAHRLRDEIFTSVSPGYAVEMRERIIRELDAGPVRTEWPKAFVWPPAEAAYIRQVLCDGCDPSHKMHRRTLKHVESTLQSIVHNWDCG